MIINLRKSKSLLISVLALVLCACSNGNSDLTKYIQEVKARPSHVVEPIPQFAPLPTYKFPENDNRRSPFKPVELKKRIDIYAPDQKRMKQALEAYPLDALKFVGTLKQQNDVWALIKLPDKQIVRIKVGDYMGENYGHVILIKDNLIKLEETTKASGEWEKRITTINLDTGK